jgi:hypothetical protein
LKPEVSFFSVSPMSDERPKLHHSHEQRSTD